MWKKEDDWFWEGNVQEKLAIFFRNLGYEVVSANTLAKSQGVDIRAKRNSQEVVLEVKGYPSDKYTSGEKLGQKKKTPATLQAHHWFSDVVFSAIRRRKQYPKSIVAIGLPDYKRYHNLIDETKWAFEKLDIHIFIVKSSGEVYKK